MNKKVLRVEPIRSLAQTGVLPDARHNGGGGRWLLVRVHTDSAPAKSDPARRQSEEEEEEATSRFGPLPRVAARREKVPSDGLTD